MNSQRKTYMHNGYSIEVVATQYDSDSKWTVRVDVGYPDGRAFPTIRDADNVYETLDEAFSAGFMLGEVHCHSKA